MGRTDRSHAQRGQVAELTGLGWVESGFDASGQRTGAGRSGDVPGGVGRRSTGGFLAGRGRLPGVYCLELAGQDDAFAVYEAGSAAAGVEAIGAGLATARSVSDHLEQLAFTRRASELVGTTDPSVESAATLLRSASTERGGSAGRDGPVEPGGSVAVRAVDVRGTTGVDTQRAEGVLGGILVDRGLTVDLDDPDHELRALFAGPPGSDGEGAVASESGVCALGWLTHDVERSFGDRQPSDRPFFQPGSMDPILARALVNVAGARPGATLLDPMCGTGGFLLEGALVGACVVGVDAQAKMVRGTRRNLRDLVPDAPAAVCRGDARRLPLADDAVDAAVVDVPYGRQSKIEAESLDTLVSDALAEVRRVAPRAVVVGDRSWAVAAREAGWTVDAQFERRVHRSLVRFIVILERE
jgi:tRNA (guanine10-N2)-dimethyltransferase